MVTDEEASVLAKLVKQGAFKAAKEYVEFLENQTKPTVPEEG